MLIDWVGGWVSHALAAYLGGIVGLIGGAVLSWYGEMSKSWDELAEQQYRSQQGSTTPEGDRRA